ncbi:MAG TPA: phage baseplate assembly protein V [Streptosporangiaceae bacterium]
MGSVNSPLLVLQPQVSIGPGLGSPLSDALCERLSRALVETHLHLPGMFELSFVGVSDEDLQQAGIVLGARMNIASSATDPAAEVSLIRGEVTAMEGSFDDFTGVVTARGYDLSHRLQRVRRTRALLNTSDAEAAQKIASAAGLEIGEITPSDVIHDHLPQYDQTDWEFLKQRAGEIGYEFAMADGLFCFRRASSVESAGAREPLTLTLHQNLRAFAARVTAGNLTPNVEVRVWDPLQARIISAQAGATTGAASAAGEQSAEEIAGLFSDPADGADPGPPPSPAVEDLGPPPSNTAFVLYDRPVGGGAATASAAELVAKGLAEQLASSFAEADGDAAGNPQVQAGAVVHIEGIGGQFPATWVVTRARHIFDLAEGGYHTEFAANGRHDRSLLGLASLGGTQAPLTRIPGVVCAVVTDVNDPSGRVKVTLPWLSPDYVSDWAPVVQFGAGARSGAMFLPEVGDQVLVGFEFGDPRRAYVLGGLVSQASNYSLGGPAVAPDGTVVRRGFVSASGNLLSFYDQMPPGDDEKPTASQLTLATKDGTVGLLADIVAGTLVLTCAPESPPGQLTIKCGDGGTVNIQAGQGGTMTVDGGDNLTVKAASSMTIQCSGDLTISGDSISLGE